MERSSAKQGSNDMFHIFILMVLCTCFRWGIIAPLGVCAHLFFVIVTILNPSFDLAFITALMELIR